MKNISPKYWLFILMIFLIQVLEAQPETGTKKTSLPKPDENFIPEFENMLVYRIEIKLVTGRGSGAGTDDPVYVQLNNEDQHFYLVKGKDNFTEGGSDTYEFISKKIIYVKDIQFIKFGVGGEDGVCITKIELFINNSLVFNKTFPGTTGQCVDVTASSLLPAYEIPGEELRRHGSWKYKSSDGKERIPPHIASKDWLLLLIEASIGNRLYQEGGKFQWGTESFVIGFGTLWGKAVEAEYSIYGSLLKVDLDLEMDHRGKNQEVDVDFNLRFKCNNGMVEITVDGIEAYCLLERGQPLDTGMLDRIVRDAISSLPPFTLKCYTNNPLETDVNGKFYLRLK
jgi:hypothetical protein